MFFHEGQNCPVCHRAFNESDDIVSCPVCGAPHHRECWKAEGGCKLQADHGTERQWSREKAEAPNQNRCPNCGRVNPEFAEVCSGCGANLNVADWAQPFRPFGGQPRGPYNQPNTPPPGQPPFGQPPPYGPPPYTYTGQPQPPFGYGGFSPFSMPVADRMGGVPPQEDLGGAAAEDVAAVVGPNSRYYLPRFSKMARTKQRASWNWAAFFVTPYWLMFRKQYAAGGIMMVIWAALQFIQNYARELITKTLPAQATTTQLYNEINAEIAAAFQAGKWGSPAVMMLLAFGAQLAVMAVFGFLGNSLYRHSCIRRVCGIKEKNPSDYKQILVHAGGTSIALAMITMLVLEMISLYTGGGF